MTIEDETVDVRPDPRTYLGGGDAAAICGINPYKTPEDVVREKLGDKDQPTQTYRMKKGLHLESLIRKWYHDQTGGNLDAIKFIRHPKHENLGGHPDCILSIGAKTQLWEIKTTNDWNLYKDGNIPEWHEAQVKHYAMLMREHVDLYPEAGIIVDRGKAEPEIFTLPLDWKKLDALRDQELAFWTAYVETRVLPDPSNIAEALARWPENTEEILDCTDPQVVAELGEYHSLQEQIKERKGKVDEIKLLLQRRMGDAGTLTYKGKSVCSWKTHERAALSVTELKADPAAALLVEKHTHSKKVRTLRPGKVKP